VKIQDGVSTSTFFGTSTHHYLFRTRRALTECIFGRTQATGALECMFMSEVTYQPASNLDLSLSLAVNICICVCMCVSNVCLAASIYERVANLFIVDDAIQLCSSETCLKLCTTVTCASDCRACFAYY